MQQQQRLEDIPVEKMPDVVRRATEMHEQDQARRNYVAAAEEMGVPREYLERAAHELQQQGVAQAQHVGRSLEARRKNMVLPMLLAAVAFAFALLLAYFLTWSSGPAALEPPRPPEVIAPLEPEANKTMPPPMNR
jgi:hypothetical protein